MDSRCGEIDLTASGSVGRVGTIVAVRAGAGGGRESIRGRTTLSFPDVFCIPALLTAMSCLSGLAAETVAGRSRRRAFWSAMWSANPVPGSNRAHVSRACGRSAALGNSAPLGFPPLPGSAHGRRGTDVTR